MLREIGSIRQDSTRGNRRWFQDDYFDVYVWQDAAGEPIAFQLCYARDRNEGALSWSAGEGFSHTRVDTGDGLRRHGMTPILRADGSPPYFRIYNRFIETSRDWEPRLREFLVERLRSYRCILFGTRRTPRRKPRRRAGS